MSLNTWAENYPDLFQILSFGLLLLGAWISFFICRSYVLKIFQALTKDISNLWAQAVFDKKLFSQIAWLVPNIIIILGTRHLNRIDIVDSEFSTFVQRISTAVMVFLGVRGIATLLNNLNASYEKLEISRNKPIKGLIQVVLIVLHLFAFLMAISIILDRSPWVFLSGIGAMTAVLLLVFRDTILSLVAGIQLTTNNFVQVGDWIEMPQFGADGDVIDMSLHAIQVQNWDKTLTIIPTHKFLENSFKNWRNMPLSGGRRIKRAIYIDVSSIHFLSTSEIEHLKRFVLLRDYLESKLKELEAANAAYKDDKDAIVNARRLTNVGCFRAYLEAYLRAKPEINLNLTFLIRQLAATDKGLPLEIYIFSSETRWANYEAIQSDIFDHTYAILEEFGLRAFQSPSGKDIQQALESLERSSQLNS